jgi:chromosome segregation protein
MIEQRAVREVLVNSQFHNIREIETGVVRGERLYGNKRYAVAYVDFRDDVVRIAENLRAFQEQLLGADYFNNPDQLRWNSYLYVLAGPESLRAKAFQEAKARIETNREYARKYVLSIDDMRELLSNSSLSVPQQGIKTTDIITTWAKALEAAQLNMLLDKPTRTKAVDLIEKGRASRKVVQQKSHELKPKDKSLTTGFLRHLRVTRFRPIHDNRAFDFTDVNLIVGPNGSGKTSLLEAIEYLYCSHNRRDGAQGPYQLEGMVQFASADYPEKITVTSDSSRIKARNFNWYRKESHQIKGILDGFTRYNFLDTDAAYRISTELDPIALSEDIRRLLVGPDASTLADYLEKVKNDIGERTKELSRKIKFETERCEALEKELVRLTQAPTQASSLAKTFRTGLREFGWKGKDTIGEFVQQAERSSIESISRSLARIQTLATVSPISKATLRGHVTVLESVANSAVTLELERVRLHEIFVKQERELLRYKQTAELLSEWYKYCASDVPSLLRKVESGRERVRRAYERLGTLVSTVVSYPSDAHRGMIVDAAARHNAAEVRNAQDEVRIAESAQRSVQSLQESLEITRRQLQTAARQLLAQGTRRDVCPVCETLHLPGELQAKIEALADAETPAPIAELATRLQEARTREAQASRRQKDLQVLLNICSKLGFDRMTMTVERTAALLKDEQYKLRKSVESLRLVEEVVEGLREIGLSTVRYHELRSRISNQFERGDKAENLDDVKQAMKEVDASIAELQEKVTIQGETLEEISRKLVSLLRGDVMPKYFAEVNTPEPVLKVLNEELSRARTALNLAEEMEEFIELPEELPLSDLVGGITNIVEAFDRAWHAAQIEQSVSTTLTQAQQAYNNARGALLDDKERMQRLKDAHKVLRNVLENNSLGTATEKVFETIREQINCPNLNLI